ncbi:cell wall hydrolase [Pseudomonas phytophila]|uniref:Cell wall hydrolase n=1 Tax=Pseudomonas phytophila TaxID=2867264 RepID=A0ABY6FM60_9PSED|nr:cell wall hydrolase [Pseudomonas phytophila]
MAKAVMVAMAVMNGAYPDPSGGATHYYANTLSRAPVWAAKAKLTLKPVRHVFFKDVLWAALLCGSPLGQSGSSMKPMPLQEWQSSRSSKRSQQLEHCLKIENCSRSHSAT